MSILDNVIQGAATLIDYGFAARQRDIENDINRKRAETERLAAEQALVNSQMVQNSIFKFARIAFFVAMAFAGVAVLTQFRKMWKAR